MQNKEYNVAIIGSGIAGSTLGAILTRHGLKVIIFEANEHPRFAIGESMILETSEMMRAAAELFDVPEIAYFSSENFASLAGTTHGVKRHFGFLHHQEGQVHDPQQTLQAVIPKEPHGHELHLYRQDTDYFMMTCAVKYGATVLQRTMIKQVDFDNDAVTIVDQAGKCYQADYLVDAGGFRSLLAQKFNLRTHDQLTHSRAIFTHAIDVPAFDDGDYGLPLTMTEGTLHHLFRGGWFWVIPFNNHAKSTNPRISIGLLLDPRIHPECSDLSPEEEFFYFVERFPAIHKQLRKLKSVRDWVRTPRIQYGSKQIVGDRWALLGHAAGFIDPLYSKGLYCSFASLFVLAHQLLLAAKSREFSRDAFLPLETITQAYLQSADLLIAHSYKSWANPQLWRVYSVLWLLGAYTELIKLNCIRISSKGSRSVYCRQLLQLSLTGGGYKGFTQIAEQVDAIIESVDLQNEAQILHAVAQIEGIFRQLDWMPLPFLALLDGKTYLPKNKIRLDLFRKKSSFMRSGDYRRHFFGNQTMWSLLPAFVAEKVKYSPFLINRQQRPQMNF